MSITDKLINSFLKEGQDKSLKAVMKASESEAGELAVQQKQDKIKSKKSKNFWEHIDRYKKSEKSIKTAKTPESKKAWEKTSEHNLNKLKSMGFVEFKKRDSGYPDDIIVKDMSIFGSKEIGTPKGLSRSGTIVMPVKPLDPAGQIEWDSTYAHEVGHQKRYHKGKRLSGGGSQWHQKKEEQAAMRDQVTHLKSEFERTGLPYRPIDAYRTMTGNNKFLQSMKNPSMVSRMKYLPTGSEPDKNVGEHLNTLWDARWDISKRGLDIKYGDDNLPTLRAIGHHKTTWEIANE